MNLRRKREDEGDLSRTQLAGKNNHGRQAEHKRKRILRQRIHALQGLTIEGEKRLSPLISTDKDTIHHEPKLNTDEFKKEDRQTATTTTILERIQRKYRES